MKHLLFVVDMLSHFKVMCFRMMAVGRNFCFFFPPNVLGGGEKFSKVGFKVQPTLNLCENFVVIH